MKNLHGKVLRTSSPLIFLAYITKPIVGGDDNDRLRKEIRYMSDRFNDIYSMENCR